MMTTTHHDVPITLEPGDHTKPTIPADLSLGETVHYSSKDGPVTILFVDNGSPFVDASGYDITVITSAAPPLPLAKRGTFTCRCFITLSTGMTVGWDPATPDVGGGNHVVH